MILLTLLAVAALVLECTASLPPGRPPRLNKVGFDSTKLVECTEQPKIQKINAGQTFHIQSPKISKNYPTMECGWTFQVTGTENVMVACSKFEMEKRDRNGNCKDFLQIGDKKFCGKNGPKNITVNVKKLVEVKFASNKSVGGFSCTMTALFNNSNTLRQSAPSCTSLEFSCAPGECIPIWHDCDGITDCSNGLDEIDCPPPCTSIEFRCKPGECIPIWHDCDDVTDCSNGLDDYDCPPPCDSSEFRCKPGECIPIEWDCDGITDCSNALDQYECPKKWSDIRNACIKGNNNNDYPGMTIDECKEKCENEESYSCQSIEYNPRYKGCYLSEAKSSSSDFNVPCYVRGWLYMEILQDPCETDKEWSDIRNACIRGNNNQDFKGVSIDVCKETCLNEDSFNCQSIEYRTSDKWCFLSEVRSTSSDYNVPCYVDGWIYTERLREDCVTAVCDPECLNNGICVGLDECRCKKGWKGDNCETAVCEPECINNGNCIGPNECECQEGWEGNHCQTAVCQIGRMEGTDCNDNLLCKFIPVHKCQEQEVSSNCPSGCNTVTVKDGSCEWNWKCSHNRPFTLTNGQFSYPEVDEKFRASVGHQTKVTMFCSGKKNTFNLFEVKKVEGTCYGGGMFHFDGHQFSNPEGYRMEDMGCKNMPDPNIVLLTKNVNECSGELLSIRFEESQESTIIDVCFDNEHKTTLWTKHTLHGQSLFLRDTGKDSDFKIGAMPKINNEDVFPGGRQRMDEIYTQKHLKVVLTTMNHQALAGEIGKASLFLAKGHMAPDGDFVTNYEQHASYHYINALPQWQSINNGNWRMIENQLRELKKDLKILSGGLEVINLGPALGPANWLYLETDKRVPVPKFTWKIAYNNNEKLFFAFLVLNNPEGVLVGNYQCIQNSFQNCYTDWKLSFKIEHGRVFCCNVGDLVKDLNKGGITLPFTLN